MSEIHASDYFAIVPEWVLDADISSNAVRLYAILNRYANTRGRAWPTRQTLADRMKVSTSTVDRARDELVEIGALTVETRISPAGDPTSNLYTVHTRPVGTVETSSPVAKGMGTRGDTRIGTRDELNKDRMKQSHLAASALTMCPECFGKYRTGYDDPDEEGLAHTYDPQTRLYRVCERCSGLGKVPK